MVVEGQNKAAGIHQMNPAAYMILRVGLRRFFRRSPVGHSYQTHNPFSRAKAQYCFVSSRNNQILIFLVSFRAGIS